MPKVSVYNILGEQVEDIDLKDDIFDIEVNETAMYEMVKNHLANRRQGTQSVKTRTEVRGGGRKPWRQKGTGNARQGSIRAVQWRKGGIAFGPKPRDYSKKQNRKVRRLALKSALSYKAKDKEIVVLENLKLETNKTKEMVNLLTKLNLVNSKVLLVVEELDENVCLASRNLGNIKVVLPTEVNTYDIMNADKMVITESALKKLEEVLDNE